MARFLSVAVASLIGLLGCGYFSSTVRAEGAFAAGHDARRFWFAVSKNKPTQAEAQAEAMRVCMTVGPYCRVDKVISGGCFAVAITIGGNGAGASHKATQTEAEQSALSICANYSNGRACSIRSSYCEMINERVEAAKREAARREVERLDQARLDQERRAREDAERRRANADAAALEAERTRRLQAESAALEAERRAQNAALSTAKPLSPLNQSLPVNLITKILGGLLVFVWLAHVKAKTTTPTTTRALVGFIVPVVQSVLLYFLGIKDEITLAEISLLSAPIGLGELVLALNYRPHHA